jgi:hypothetical protein
MSKFVGLRHLTSIVRPSSQILDSCRDSEQEKTPASAVFRGCYVPNHHEGPTHFAALFQFGSGVTQLDVAFITFQISRSLGPFWF